MSTSDLISRLTEDLRPVARGAVWRRVAYGIGAGSIASVGLMVAWLGIRPDLAEAVLTSAFWIKFGYTALAAVFACLATERLSRPGCDPRTAFAALALLVAVIGVLALAELATAPPAGRLHLVVGNSSLVCPLYIVALSLPLLAASLWAVRGLAPTRLALAGAAAGLLSGGAGAFIYSFHCDEVAVTFLVLWYSLGIAAAGVLGAILGRTALRW